MRIGTQLNAVLMKSLGLREFLMSRKPEFIQLNSEAKEELSDALKTATKQGGLRYRRRLQIIWFSLEDWSVECIANYFKVSQQTVWKWRRIYKEKGLEGLRSKYFSHRL